MPEIPPQAAPGDPVQVLVPAGLIPRLAVPLATIGMRLYQLPTKDGPTLMIAADLSELRDPNAPTSLTTADVLEAWSYAVDALEERAEEAATLRKSRKRKTTRDAA